jgi:hypothetical protein
MIRILKDGIWGQDFIVSERISNPRYDETPDEVG